MSAKLGASVLVLEDSDEDFDTLMQAAGQVNLHNDFLRAQTGDECLARLQGGPGIRLEPAIILLDLNTPGMDGREALTLIRADPKLQSVPVVVLSTSSNPKDISYCYAEGANAYHVKPVRYEEHLKVLNEMLSYWLKQAVLPHSVEVRT